MIYEAVIPGALPTLHKYARVSRSERNLLSIDTDLRIREAFERAPSFSGRAYIGFQWIRPNMRATAEESTFARGFIIDALKQAGIIRKDKVCFYADLCFMVNSRNPRTVVCIADSEAELLDHFAETAGCAHA